MRNHRLPVLLAILSIVCVGCQNTRDEEPVRVDATPHANLVKQAKQDWSWISGTTWIATAIEGQEPLENTSLWVRFEEHTWLVGSAGCNSISASYDRKGIDGLKISDIAATRMHCAQPDGTMQQESRFLHLLANIDAYHAEPNTLKLSTNAITMLTFKRFEQSDE